MPNAYISNSHTRKTKSYLQTLPQETSHERHHLIEHVNDQKRSRLKSISHSRHNITAEFVNGHPRSKLKISNNLIKEPKNSQANKNRLMKSRRYSEANSPSSYGYGNSGHLEQKKNPKHRLHSQMNLASSQQKRQNINLPHKYSIEINKKKPIFNSHHYEFFQNNSQSKESSGFEDWVDVRCKEQRLKAQNCQRIKQIYNPTLKTKSISILRSKMPIKATINKLQAPSESSRKSRKQPKIRFPTKKNSPESRAGFDHDQTRPQISDVTKQKIEQLSIIRQEPKDSLTQKSNDSTKIMPLPKFSKFYDSYTMTIHQSKAKSSSQKSTKINEGNQQTQNSPHSKCNLIPETHEIRNAHKVPAFQFLSNLQSLSEIKIIKQSQGVYYGQLNQHNKKTGKGVYFYQSGIIYEGDFANGIKQGNGRQIFPDGSSYQGQFSQGKRSGKGRFQWANGQIYDGQWQSNKKHGSGLWQDPEGSSYLGQWKEDAISGFGVLTTAIAEGQQQLYERYEGQFVNFSKQGQGTYRFANGQKVIGNFYKNQPNGECEYYWKNGDYYKGQFLNGLRHGKGYLKYNSGAEYEGEFRNDKKCGLGRQTYNDGIVYMGNYENDLRHGYGKLEYVGTIYYEGYWLNNRAVIFNNDEDSENDGGMTEQTEKVNYQRMDSIEEDVVNERLVSRFSNKLSKEKIEKLKTDEKKKLMTAMRSKEKLGKSKVQRFSSKNLLQRLYNPRKRACRCAAKH